MANTYYLIQSNIVTASGGAASITFSSIPSTYTDLKVVCSTRDSDTGGATVAMSFNGVTTNLSSRDLRSTNSTISSNTSTTARAITALSNSGDRTANTFGNIEFYIPNYTGSNYKVVIGEGVEENNATARSSNLFTAAWASTAAITTILLSPSVANFKQYSSFYLYGIKNS